MKNLYKFSLLLHTGDVIREVLDIVKVEGDIYLYKPYLYDGLIYNSIPMKCIGKVNENPSLHSDRISVISFEDNKEAASAVLLMKLIEIKSETVEKHKRELQKIDMQIALAMEKQGQCIESTEQNYEQE